MRDHPAAVVVLGLGIAFSLVAFLWLQARERQASRLAFERRASRAVSSFRTNLERPLEVVRTLPALFEASEEVTRDEFRAFARPALSRHADIMALGWVPRVPANQRMAFEDAGRRQGIAPHGITELHGGEWVRAGDRAEYFPIVYVEPTFPRFLGYDEASEPRRADALSRARDSGAAAASRRITVLGDGSEVAGMIVFGPIYRRGSTPATVEARRQELRGFVVQVFRFASVFEGLNKLEDLGGLELELFDVTEPERPELLHVQKSAAGARGAGEPVTTSTNLPFAGRSWSMRVSGTAPIAATPFALLGAGLLLTTLSSAGAVALGTILRLRRRMQAALKLGPFTLVEKLGEGGMGVVYKATHALLKRPTAVKLVRLGEENAGVLQRFEREVQLTSSLTHPNTIAVYDYERTRDGVFYYAMEYIDGITLEQLVERAGPLPGARVARILEQVAGALAEAHSIGLIHRDIKPANIMISRRGGLPDFVKVLDFGLVRSIAGDDGLTSSVAVTQASALVGTPLYLSPEAISRSSELDGRSDLYSLGAVAYYLLTGGPLFRATTVVEICGHHLHTRPEPPSARAPEPVPPALEAIVMRCLDKTPSRRFASAGELLNELRALRDIGTWTEVEARAWWNDEGDALVLAVRAGTAARVSEPLTVGGR